MSSQLAQPQGKLLASGDFFRILDLLPGRADDPIHCSLRVASLDDQIEYEALSYVWGHHGRTIWIDGLEFSVTVNLCAALKRLRHPSSKRALWIDQLCINQQDGDEKAHQVNMMRRIYKTCTRCLIWLGDIPESRGFSILDAEALFDYIRVLSGDMGEGILAVGSSKMSTAALGGVCAAFRALMLDGNPWWSRIWTVQEAVLTQEAIILWGHLTISRDTLEAAAVGLCIGRWPYAIQNMIDGLGQSDIDNFTAPVRGLSIARAGENPLNLLQRWRHREATDPRDKVYALMGLFPSTPFPSIQSCRYDISPAELFAKVTRDLIELESGLRAFVGRRGEPHVTEDLPTWALDLVRFPDVKRRAWKWWNNSHRYQKFTTCGSKPLTLATSKDPFILSLTGVCIDEIVAVGEVLREDTFGELPDEDIIGILNSWEKLLAKFLAQQATSVPSRYFSWPEAFARTVLGDFIMEEFPVRRVNDHDLFDLKTFRNTGVKGSSYLSIRDMAVKQAFFITKTGYLGLGPPNLRPGDEVWILFGGQVPFILRRRGGGSQDSMEASTAHEYLFVGDSYVCGIMDGEAVKNFADRQATISLY